MAQQSVAANQRKLLKMWKIQTAERCDARRCRLGLALGRIFLTLILLQCSSKLQDDMQTKFGQLALAGQEAQDKMVVSIWWLSHNCHARRRAIAPHSLDFQFKQQKQQKFRKQSKRSLTCNSSG